MLPLSSEVRISQTMLTALLWERQQANRICVIFHLCETEIEAWPKMTNRDGTVYCFTQLSFLFQTNAILTWWLTEQLKPWVIRRHLGFSIFLKRVFGQCGCPAFSVYLLDLHLLKIIKHPVIRTDVMHCVLKGYNVKSLKTSHSLGTGENLIGHCCGANDHIIMSSLTGRPQ